MSKRNRETVGDPEFIDLTGEDSDEDRDGSTAATVALQATQHQQQGSNRSEAARAKRARMQLIRATAARVAVLAWELQKLGHPVEPTSGAFLSPLSLSLAAGLALKGAGAF